MSFDQKQSCMHCKFWKMNSRGVPEDLIPASAGACRVNPPIVMQAGSHANIYPNTCWPMTKGGDWCGRFEMPRDDYADIRPWRHISEISVDFDK